MASDPHRDVLAEAIAWHLRLQEGRDEDWSAFVQWLEGDPARSDAYDAVEAGHEAMRAEAFPPDAAAPPVAANDETQRWHGARWVVGLAGLAAVLLIAFLTLPMLTSPADRFELATAAGQQRRFAFVDGSSVVMNGATRLILDRDDPRHAELITGEATFTVSHDNERPFTVISGDHRVQDVGTSFNLIRDQADFSVEVIEGEVIYDPDSAAVRLAAGQILHASGSGRPTVLRANPQSIAGWRSGQLSYGGAPMSRVARDMSRTLGVRIALDPAVAQLPFTGSVRIQRDPGATVNDLAAAVGLQARRTGSGWIIEPHKRAPR